MPHVSVVHLENADPQQVQQVLQDMFQSSQTSRSSQTQVSPLQNRIQQNTGHARPPARGLGSLGSGTWCAPDSEELRFEREPAVIARNL